jgi:ribosome biogenesis protein ENP2
MPPCLPGRSLVEPFAYEAYRQQRIAKKIEEERASRISLIKKLPKVTL